jgi:predicted PurR-regulated permease PerM
MEQEREAPERRRAPWFQWFLDQRNVRYAMLLLMVLLVAATVVVFREVMLPFLLAIFLAYLLDPVVAAFNRVKIGRFRVHRGVGVLLVYAIILGVIGLGGYLGIPKVFAELNRMGRTLPAQLAAFERDFVKPLDREINALLADYLPSAVPSPAESSPAAPQTPPLPPAENPTAQAAPPPAEPPLRGILDSYTFVIRQLDDGRYEIVPQRKKPKPTAATGSGLSVNQQVTHYFEQFRADFDENLGEWLNRGRRLLQDVSSAVFTTFLVLMLSGFILVNPGRIGHFMRSMIPDKHQPIYEEWLERLDRGLGGVVRGQVIICLINGTLTAIGISWLGVPYWFTLSIVATVTSLIPIFGVLISSAPIVVMALTVSFGTALLAVGWILLVHFLEGNFLNPKIMGDAAKIHPVLIVFSLVVGQHFAGLIGALLAVPVFSLIYNSFRYLKSLADEMEHPA